MGDVDKRQKLPVNENTNFNSAHCVPSPGLRAAHTVPPRRPVLLNQHNPSKERDAHFLISVKKSKKDRKGAGAPPSLACRRARA